MATNTDATAADGAGAATAAGRLREFWQVLKTAGADWNRDNAMRLSAAVAMYTILSLSPLLVIAVKVAGLAMQGPALNAEVHKQVQAYIGEKGATAVDGMIDAANQSKSGVIATVLSLGLLLFTASGVFVEVRGSLNALWGIDPKYSSGLWSMVRERLLSFGMVLTVGLLLLASQVLTTTLTAVSEYAVGGAKGAAVAVDLAASTVLVTTLFALVFRFLPDARVRWRYAWAGAAVTAVLFKVGQYVQALYFTYVSTGSAYGAAGSFVVVMLWVYYSSWILFYGAELIKVYGRLRGHPIEPTANAVRANVIAVDRSVRGGVAPKDAPPAPEPY